MDSTPSSRPSRGRAWLWGVGVVLLVVGAGLAVWRFGGRSSPDSDAAAAAAAAGGAHLARGDYYLHVKLIELSDRRPDGKTWDTGGSAPDVRFNLTWRNNVVWESTAKPDTLIGSWDLMKIDLRQVIASGGKADIESALNAPLIHYEPGETVKLTVWDEDAMGSDAAGALVLKLDDLGPGETSITPAPSDAAKAVKRVVVALIDRKTPLPELIETMSNR